MEEEGCVGCCGAESVVRIWFVFDEEDDAEVCIWRPALGTLASARTAMGYLVEAFDMKTRSGL